jgi:hypothetical protein
LAEGHLKRRAAVTGDTGPDRTGADGIERVVESASESILSEAGPGGALQKQPQNGAISAIWAYDVSGFPKFKKEIPAKTQGSLQGFSSARF